MLSNANVLRTDLGLYVTVDRPYTKDMPSRREIQRNGLRPCQHLMMIGHALYGYRGAWQGLAPTVSLHWEFNQEDKGHCQSCHGGPVKTAKRWHRFSMFYIFINTVYRVCRLWLFLYILYCRLTPVCVCQQLFSQTGHRIFPFWNLVYEGDKGRFSGKNLVWWKIHEASQNRGFGEISHELQ